MYKYICAAFVLASIIACTKAQKNIVINAEIPGLPCKKVYIAEAHEWEKFLDSADYVNGRFTFDKKAKKEFTPFMASIVYWDTVAGKIKTLYFRNHLLSPKGTTKYLLNAFVTNIGVTRMKRYNNDSSYISISGSKETEAMFYTQMMDFGFINEQASDKRTAILNTYQDIIKKYPSSFYLFKEIYSNSVTYSKKELQNMLQLFDTSVTHSGLGKQFTEYVAQMDDKPLDYLQQSFKTVDGINKKIVDTSSKLTMLVFWASWCGPCRAEIPLLKKMHKVFKRSNINIVSISTDKDISKWKKAMEQEKMPWLQLIADSAEVDRVGARFKFSAIPCLIVVDKTGKEVYRTMGFDPNAPDAQKISFIYSLLQP